MWNIWMQVAESGVDADTAFMKNLEWSLKWGLLEIDAEIADFLRAEVKRQKGEK